MAENAAGDRCGVAADGGVGDGQRAANAIEDTASNQRCSARQNSVAADGGVDEGQRAVGAENPLMLQTSIFSSHHL